MMSAKLMPQARARMRTSPGFGIGSGASRTSSTSGGPTRVIQTCLICPPLRAYPPPHHRFHGIVRDLQQRVAMRLGEQLELRPQLLVQVTDRALMVVMAQEGIELPREISERLRRRTFGRRVGR